MRLKEIRLQEKKDVKEVASFLGISEQAYYKYENLKSQPSIENLKKLADYFNISIDYLVGRNFNNEFGYITEKDKDALRLFLGLTEQNKLKASAFIAGLLATQN